MASETGVLGIKNNIWRAPLTTGKSIEENRETAQGNSETTSAHHNRYTKSAYCIFFYLAASDSMMI